MSVWFWVKGPNQTKSESSDSTNVTIQTLTRRRRKGNKTSNTFSQYEIVNSLICAAYIDYSKKKKKCSRVFKGAAAPLAKDPFH